MTSKPDSEQDPNHLYANAPKGRKSIMPWVIAIAALVITLGALAVFGILGLFLGISDSKPKHDSKPHENVANELPHVFLISIDTLRADVLGCYGGEAKTPFLDKLAAEGVRFEKCFTPNPLTLPAHASMLSGTSPIYHQVRDNTYQRVPKENLVLLQEEFRRLNYRTGAFVSSSVVKDGSGLERGFDHYDDEIHAASAETTLDERNAKDTLAAAQAWLAPNKNPAFTFIHLFDPHFPYWPPNAAERGLVPAKGLAPEEIRPLYIAEVEYVDEQLKRFFDAMRASGKLDNALIVITADHGEDLGDRGEITHGYTLYDATTHVPMIVWKNGLAPSTVPSAVSLCDVFSGVIDYAGLELSETAKAQQQGISLKRAAEATAPTGRQVYLETHYGFLQSGWARLRGLHDGTRLTIIHDSLPEVYAPYSADAENLYAKGDAAAKAAYVEARQIIGERLNAWYATGRATTLADEASRGYEHGALTKQEAENLGYPVNALGAPSFEKEFLSDSEGRPSPHARVDEIGRLQRAFIDFTGGKRSSALALLEPIVNPRDGAGEAGMQALKFYARVALESANQALGEQRFPAARRDAELALAALWRGEKAAKSVKLDLAALEMEEAALLLELRLAKGEEALVAVVKKTEALADRTKSSGHPELVTKSAKLDILARYTLAHTAPTEAMDKFVIVSEMVGLDPKDVRIPAMRKGDPVIPAFP